MEPIEGEHSQPADALSQNRPAAAIASPITPPTHRGTAPRHQRAPVWPTVIGILSIVLASAAILMTVGGLLIMLAFKGVASSIPGAGITPRVVALSLVSGSLAVLVGGVLLAAGIQACRRRRAGRPLHMSWAVLKLVYAVIATVIGHFVQQEQMRAFAADPSANPVGNAAAMSVVSAMVWVQLGFVFLWYSAYPIFILIWFNSRAVKRDCAAWK